MCKFRRTLNVPLFFFIILTSLTSPIFEKKATTSFSVPFSGMSPTYNRFPGMLGGGGDVAPRALDVCLLFPLLGYPFLFWDELEDTSDGTSEHVSSISETSFPFPALTYASSVSSPEESRIDNSLLIFFPTSSEVSDSLLEDSMPGGLRRKTSLYVAVSVRILGICNPGRVEDCVFSGNLVLIVMLMVHANLS